MRADAVSVRELLEHRDSAGIPRPVQFRVPVFQRTYEWRPETVETLLSDVKVAMNDGESGRPHFIGSMVFLDEPEASGQPDHMMVIDGQQRLLTIATTIALTERRLNESGGSWLRNTGFELGTRERFRPAKADRLAFEALVAGAQPPAAHRLVRASAAIRSQTEGVDPGGMLAAILDKLSVVRVLLDQRDDAETVFESLNFTGQALTEADLVRTWLLARFGQVDTQESLDDTYWRPMADRLQASVPDRTGRQRVSPKDTIIDWYLREWSMRNGGRVDSSRVYKTFVESTPPTPEGAMAALQALEATSRNYVRLEDPKETDPEYAQLRRLRDIRYNVHWPLMLQLMDRADVGSFPKEDVSNVLAACESLYVRRAVVGWPTNILGRMFEQIAAVRPIDADDVTKRLLPNWPSDERFVDQLASAPLYESRYPRQVVRLILQRLDFAYGNKESKLDPDASIEHVMPQSVSNNANGRAWMEMLGDDWKRIHSDWLHTLGNISMTRTNAEMSNKPFTGPGGKREWLARSLFEMNRRIAANEVWTEVQMIARRDLFVDRALVIWHRPRTDVPADARTGQAEAGSRDV